MVSKLTKQKIRDIWKTEDKEFTPWLVENIALLNEDLGLNIQDPESEKKLDTFKVDIVAQDNEGKVVIENQFEKSNHDHLGKLLTYISNVENTKKAIWIVEDAKSEHQRAVDWLNANVKTCSFYLVKIQVFKIKDRIDLLSNIIGIVISRSDRLVVSLLLRNRSSAGIIILCLTNSIRR